MESTKDKSCISLFRRGDLCRPFFEVVFCFTFVVFVRTYFPVRFSERNVEAARFVDQNAVESLELGRSSPLGKRIAGNVW